MAKLAAVLGRPMRAAALLLVFVSMPAAARKYKYLDYQQIADELHELAKVRNFAIAFVSHASYVGATVEFPIIMF